MTIKQLEIVEAALEVAVYSKTHEWPQIDSPEFFDFAHKLDRLADAINAEYPGFNRNVRRGGANSEMSRRAPGAGQ